jgi:hypothetical protein
MTRFSEHLAAICAGKKPPRAKRQAPATTDTGIHYVGGITGRAPCGARVSGRVGEQSDEPIRTSTASPRAITCAKCRELLRAKWTRDLATAQAKSTKAMEARGRLPIGSTRARVTTANANWMRAAEFRDRIAEQLAELAEENAK